MSYTLKIFFILCLSLVQSLIIDDQNIYKSNNESSEDFLNINNNIPENVFNGVYTECFLYLSYSCLQEKTLLYLKELNKLSEVSVLGEYVKFVKINGTEDGRRLEESNNTTTDSQEDLSVRIDKAVNNFFHGHILKFNAFGEDVTVPNSVDEFVGRKRKGGGGGHGGGHDHGGDDGGKKKMMMMALMCMKMKFMMMVPAMMGMMGMMSFKGMMFSMMSFMISKMMLLMKILEKKGLAGGGDAGWAAGGGGGGGGGAWMPAGGQDYGGGGGGYDANGQWQNRALNGVIENGPLAEHDPIYTFIPPLVRANQRRGDKLYSTIKQLNGEAAKTEPKTNSRKKRGIVDVLQNAYMYWLNKILGAKTQRIIPRYPKYRIINGVRYVYSPIVYVKKPKQLIPHAETKPVSTPIVASEDFNKGEILEGPAEIAESRNFNFNKIKKFTNDVNEVIEQDPWE